MNYRWEPVNYLLQTGLLELVNRYYAEIENPNIIKNDPDWARYKKMEDENILRFMAARDDSNNLVGFASVIIGPNLHDRTLCHALIQDIYVTPEARKRRVGLILIWTLKEQLANIGAKQMTIAERTDHETEVGKLYEHLGGFSNERLWIIPLEGRA